MSKNVTGLISWLRQWFDDIYVAKITGKGLSTNDYTTAEKNKLTGIEAQANKTVVDANLSQTSTNPVQNKAIYNNCLLVEDYELDNVSDKIPIKITSQGQYIRGMGFNDGDSIEAVLEEFAGRIAELQTQWDNVYPVGAIYISVNNTNPSTLFGGTWVQLTNTFLYASTTSDSNATTATAGSKDAVVVSHNHTQNAHNHSQNAHSHKLPNSAIVYSASYSGAIPNGTAKKYGTNSDAKLYTDSATASNNATTATNNATGVDGTDKNMPPYMKVYMWKRTA